MRKITLNNGIEMPGLSFGTWQSLLLCHTVVVCALTRISLNSDGKRRQRNVL